MPSRPNSNVSAEGSKSRKAALRKQAQVVEAEEAPQPPEDGFDLRQEPSPNFEPANPQVGRQSQSSSRNALPGLAPSSRHSTGDPTSHGNTPLQHEQPHALHPSYFSPHVTPPAFVPPDRVHRQHESQVPSNSPQSHQQIAYSNPRSPHAAPQPRFPIHPPQPVAKQKQWQRDQTQELKFPKPYFRSFDSLEAAGIPGVVTDESVILCGWNNRLDVYAKQEKELKLIGRIDQINGAITAAKVVTITNLQDAFADQRPLIALIVHEYAPTGFSEGYQPDFNDSFPVETHHIQNKVEIWSLKTGNFVATLYKSPLIPLSHAQASFLCNRSADTSSVGHLRVEVKGDFIVVASGLSGEVFVFTPTSQAKPLNEPFRCIAKFWTSIARVASPPNGASSSYPDVSEATDEKRPSYVAVFSLSHRWLAIAPPNSQSRHSIQGAVPISTNDSKPVGVESVTPSAPPASNCILDVPNPESLTNKVARGVAKEVVKGAHWVSAQGWQAWQNYWNPSAQPSSTTSPRSETVATHQFPPTHAESQGVGTEAEDKGEQVSIIDLKQLLQSSKKTSARKRSEPLATFSLPQGCSFLSFSPHGLLLLTVSTNGDTQHVWNLSKIRGRKESTSELASSKPTQPSIIQAATFSRFSNTRVVDVVWSKPKNDQLAMVTERGTIHIFKLPSSPFTWPLHHGTTNRREFRASFPEPSSGHSETQMNDTRLPLSQAGPLSVAASKVSSTARPIVTTVRQRSNSGVATITSNLANFNISTSAGMQGGKYLVNGVSKSFGVAAGHINQIRRASASRLSIKGGSEHARQACVRFLTGKDRGFIGALSTDSLQLHWMHASSGKPSPWKDFEIPFPDLQQLHQPQLPDQQGQFWRPILDASSRLDSTDDLSAVTPRADLATSLHPLASAEIETSASFQPFYTEPHISLSTYKEPEPWDFEAPALEDPNHLNDSNPWVFGHEIPAVPVDLSIQAAQDDIHSGGQDPDNHGPDVFIDNPPIPDTRLEPTTSLDSMHEDEEDLEESTLKMNIEEEEVLIDVGSKKKERR